MEEFKLNKKIGLIAPILLVLTLGMLVGPAAASPSLTGIIFPGNNTVWAVGKGFVYKNGLLT
jgi:hypothetical protein